MYRLLIALAAFVLLVSSALAQQPQQPGRKGMSDYRTPPRAYQQVTLEGRTFTVEKQLLAEDPATARKALERLNKNIDRALSLVPTHAHPHLTKQRFYLMYGPRSRGGGKENGLAYFRPGSPKFNQKLPEEWQSVVVVYHARNYAALTDLWALKSVLHELGHAYQLEQWPEKQPDIMAAYQRAMAGNLYRNVLDIKGKRLPAAYATTNQLEYFAELTSMYFARCNYQPSNAEELKVYDPAGFAMIEKMWKVGPTYGKPEVRDWTIGRRRYQAKLDSVKDDRVTLVDARGNKRTVVLRVLSDADRAYLKQWTKSPTAQP